MLGPLEVRADSGEELGVGGARLRALASLDGSAAVRLLAQRARAVLPGFEVTAANAPAVARICRGRA
jgi:predicted ATPase